MNYPKQFFTDGGLEQTAKHWWSTLRAKPRALWVSEPPYNPTTIILRATTPYKTDITLETITQQDAQITPGLYKNKELAALLEELHKNNEEETIVRETAYLSMPEKGEMNVSKYYEEEGGLFVYMTGREQMWDVSNAELVTVHRVEGFELDPYEHKKIITATEVFLDTILHVVPGYAAILSTHGL